MRVVQVGLLPVVLHLHTPGEGGAGWIVPVVLHLHTVGEGGTGWIVTCSATPAYTW